MKVFVTGGSGYIGAAIVGELLAQGHAVEGLARSERAGATVESLGATAVRGGLRDLDVLNQAAARSEAVIHLAQASSGDEDLSAATAMQDGVGTGVYIHTGGSWVYGDTHGTADESAPWNPPGLVAWRRPVEQAVLRRAATGGRPVIIQPGLLYGGDNRLIDEFFIRPGIGHGAIPVIGTGANHWSLVHVDDLARLYVAALSAAAGSVYLGVGDVAPTAERVAQACAQGAGLNGATRSITIDEARASMGPVADAFVLDQQLTSARAQADLDWAPRHGDPLSEFARA
ncbi:NAD-dependent epimerase/dehydratase family protein [Williamsia sp.]|uniref:NAD-dependent epimerase/dehydratase family protein n=1 Tax=Williamsia sp. TaxID=1872085 RepID=UPI001A1ACF3A|nr:NAD-dependent epimerase/dehydratase family protein [Williamsia sp.]MBJ7288180.1 NAD-dependent epimerase/dehydratase family protein [Williamsia sp.]